MYEVEQGVPLPTDSRAAKYPFGEMAVGDSFFVPDHHSTYTSVAGSAYGYARRHGLKMSVAKEDTGTRVWRTE